MAPSWGAFSRAFKLLAMPLMLVGALVGPLFSQPGEAQSAPPPGSVVTASCPGPPRFGSFGAVTYSSAQVLGQVFTSS